HCLHSVHYISPSRMFIFFILLTRPPPTSTLFPYTTLFRSINHSPVPTVYWCSSAPNPFPNYLIRTHGEPMAMAETLRRKIHEIEDRKSTRLNSSHVAISYAVFCL